jgi:hypothetical protein
MKSILDPSFRYTASFNTDLKKTFARIRREHRKDTERAVQAPQMRSPTFRRLPERQRQAGEEAFAAPLDLN